MRISCVVVCYNQVRFIEEAVLSVAGPSRKIGGGVKLPKIMAIAVTASSLRVFAVKVAGRRRSTSAF